MSEFIPFDQNAEVYGAALFALVKAFPVGEERRKQILTENNVLLKEDGWYPQAKFLSSLKQLQEEVGVEMLEKTGMLIPQHAIFPPQIKSLMDALASIDAAYQMNHRNGEIGYYKLTDFNDAKKVAVMECKNPYPSFFDLGLIKGMVKKFLPKTSFHYDVKLDESKESRLNGAESCAYIIKW